MLMLNTELGDKWPKMNIQWNTFQCEIKSAKSSNVIQNFTLRSEKANPDACTKTLEPAGAEMERHKFAPADGAAQRKP
jgi:hypothetical protein